MKHARVLKKKMRNKRHWIRAFAWNPE